MELVTHFFTLKHGCKFFNLFLFFKYFFPQILYGNKNQQRNYLNICIQQSINNAQ